MHDLWRTVSKSDLLGRVADLLPPETYLVGGCIRDMLLGRDPLDFDLLTFSPVADLAGRIASRLHSRPFWMDEKRGVMRIVLKNGGARIDISGPKGESVGEDLRSRDLTINAMAYDLNRRVLLDPLSGKCDLAHGVLRIISEENLLDDPLRALRALRFSVTLGFAVEARSFRMIREHARLLGRVSGERIRQEFVQALGDVNGAAFFRQLAWGSLVPVLFAPYFPGSGTAEDGTDSLVLTLVPACQELDGIVYAGNALMPGSADFLACETEAGVPRVALLRLSAFLLGLEDLRQAQGSGPSLEDRAADFCSGLRFSSRSLRTVRTLVGGARRTASLLGQESPSAVDIHRFCEDLAGLVPESLLLGLSRMGTRRSQPRQTAAGVWEYCRTTYGEHKSSPLISGADIVGMLGGAGGPEVGRWLRTVEEARAQGTVRTRGEAMEYLRLIMGR